jgi:hypothetical protein
MSWSNRHHPFKMDCPHQSNPEQNAPRPNPSFIRHFPPRENWIGVTGRVAGWRDCNRKAVPAVVTTVSTQPTASVARAWVPYLCMTVDVLICGGARVPSRGSSGAVASMMRWTLMHQRASKPRSTIRSDVGNQMTSAVARGQGDTVEHNQRW